MTSTGTATADGRFPQGDLRLLDTDLAQQLLHSAIPARMAFVWTDGTPRVIPTWFHWTGEEVVMVTYTAGPDIGIRHPATRLAVLRANPRVALTIDTNAFPPQTLEAFKRLVAQNPAKPVHLYSMSLDDNDAILESLVDQRWLLEHGSLSLSLQRPIDWQRSSTIRIAEIGAADMLLFNPLQP